MRFIAISGFAKSGKSSLISLIIRNFSKRGIEACVIKRAEEIEIMKHEAEFIESGAKGVFVISPDVSLAVFNRKIGPEEIPALISCDFLLLEGFKGDPLPRIVIANDEENASKLVDEWTLAITSLQTTLNVGKIPFVPPQEIPEFLLDKSPYFPLWTNCGLCGFQNCIAFLRNSMSKTPTPCPATVNRSSDGER
jgi:molybdopterin-guanine dinucleotide biosynthesis protein MobB